MMRIAFRADASTQIGTGHVMRCLTLAEELKRQGHECLFICRDHQGHLSRQITEKGFALTLLPGSDEAGDDLSELNWNNHASWLGVHWRQDAQQTREILSPHPIDWLVVDHYALDARWEQLVAEYANRIMAIDDLADRPHHCDLLLDQTFGRSQEDYRPLVSNNCELLCGSQYALLRPEFAKLREYSLNRRSTPELKQLLITMGGVDKDNTTVQVLDALRDSKLPDSCRIVVVMGATAPWLEAVRQQAESLPWLTEVKVGVSNMAQLMADSDLAIGAAGATSWERCCLGLPSILITIAENQQIIARNMSNVGAAVCLSDDFNKKNLTSALKRIDLLSLSNLASNVCDGLGVIYVAKNIIGDTDVSAKD